MTAIDPSSIQQLPNRISLRQPLLHAALAASLALLILSLAFWNFRLAQEDDFLRVSVLASEIVSGIAAAVCFGIAIHFLQTALDSRPALLFRFLLHAKTRGLMLAQILAMALAIGAAGLLVLHKPIPGPDRSILYPGWVPPQSATQP